MSNHLTKKDFDKISRALSAPGASITKVTAKYPHGKRTISRVSSVKNCGTPGMTGFKGYKMRLAQESHDRRRKIIKEAYELADRSSGGSQNVSPAELHRQDVLRTLHASQNDEIGGIDYMPPDFGRVLFMVLWGILCFVAGCIFMSWFL